MVRASVSAAPGASQFIVFKEAFIEFERPGEGMVRAGLA
ncbi:hypothetical protein RR42_s0390 [Cupriavidus basilensis]|uniref:Uncharacterized protein n=1 Tax=Cupriavidus basilensis TaxID=68895 RepID=A0A0C4YN60_9BURK|nr:hypothetical protein RR42_s0390 [Cupriavidus basilensis]